VEELDNTKDLDHQNDIERVGGDAKVVPVDTATQLSA